MVRKAAKARGTALTRRSITDPDGNRRDLSVPVPRLIKNRVLRENPTPPGTPRRVVIKHRR